MCYSAQVVADYAEYVRKFGAQINIRDFFELYFKRNSGPAKSGSKIHTPKAMDAAFLHPLAADVQPLIAEWNVKQVSALEIQIFAQRKRLVDAERKLQIKASKAAAESARIARNKVSWALRKLADVKRTELKPEDSRIFPGWYAPVMVVQNGQRVIKPMRYQCRPAGMPASTDVRFPGTYNARRDNLNRFWRGQWGYTHGIMLAPAFFENVAKHNMEQRELRPGEQAENLILEFRPQGLEEMLVACLYSHWQEGADELWSFAAITDEPPPEVSAAGHDRCIIPIKYEHIDAWLNPDALKLAALESILDDRQRPFYQYRLAVAA